MMKGNFFDSSISFYVVSALEHDNRSEDMTQEIDGAYAIMRSRP